MRETERIYPGNFSEQHAAAQVWLYIYTHDRHTLRSQRLFDGRQIDTFNCCHALAIFEDKKDGFDTALIFLEKRHFVEGSCGELEAFI